MLIHYSSERVMNQAENDAKFSRIDVCPCYFGINLSRPVPLSRAINGANCRNNSDFEV